ncbi:MAG TPA: hypothetical protein HPP66_05140 [Planctomycetes bacterium]|nr:hypothetical protein [Planctomycetota bacterium]
MRSKNLLAVAAGLAACVLVVLSSKSIQGGQKKYELRPQVTIPEYRTDAARAIDAYERLMNRYMGLTERNLIRIETNLGNIVKKLDSIDRRLTELSARMTRIEKALGAGQAKPPVEGVLQHKKERLAPQKKRDKELLPSS